MNLPIKLLPHACGLPTYATAGSAGMDLCAAFSRAWPVDGMDVWERADGDAFIELDPLVRAAIPTGLQVEIPPGYEGQVRPRSGLALRSGVTVLNAPGTVDADYRGEVVVLLVNLGSVAVTIKRGDRIAQLVLAPCVRVTLVQVDALEETARGCGGLGSSGR